MDTPTPAPKANQPKLLSLQIVSSVSHQTFTSFCDAPGAGDVAVVNTGEEFQVTAKIMNAGKALPKVKVMLQLPKGYTSKQAFKQEPLLVPKDETDVVWNVVATSTPDSDAKTICVVLEPEDGQRKMQVPANSLEIQTMAGPSQLVFTTPGISAMVGEPSCPITIQTQNDLNQAQNPANAIPLKLASTSATCAFFADQLCTRPVGTVTIPASADSVTVYYQDFSAGKPTITASDNSGSLIALAFGQLQLSIDQATTDTELTCSPNPTANQPVTLTATVAAESPAVATPTGQVQFCDGSLILQTAPLKSPAGNPNTASMPFALSPGTHSITAAYSGDQNCVASVSDPVSVTVGVQIGGNVLTAAGQTPIAGVSVIAQDSSGNQIVSGSTDSKGSYALSVPPGAPVYVVFPPSSPGPNGQTLYLKPPGTIHIAQPGTATGALPSAYYELRECQVSGMVLQQVGSKTQPLSGVPVNLIDLSQPSTQYGASTDAQGKFCFNPTSGTQFVLQLPPTVSVSQGIYVLSPDSQTQTGIVLTPDLSSALKAFIYQPQMATVIGQVTDGLNGINGVTVELSGQPVTTDAMGFYKFPALQPGSAQLMFPSPATDANGNVWELQPGQPSTRTLKLLAGHVINAPTMNYQPEQHSIEQLVLMDGKPAEGMLVDVRPAGAPYAIQSQRTGRDGKVTFMLATSGKYEVRVYPDPSAFGGPQVNEVEVQSKARPPAMNLATPVGTVNNTRIPNGEKADIDLQAYPVLTEEVPAGVLPSTTRGGLQRSWAGLRRSRKLPTKPSGKS